MSLLEEWKLWVGLGLSAMSCVSDYCFSTASAVELGEVVTHLLMYLGGNLLLLLAIEQNFMAEMLLVVCICLVRFVARGLLAYFTSSGKSTEGQGEVVLRVHSMYKDLTVPLASCLIRFAIQTMFVVYIFMYIDERKDTRRSILFWASTLPLQLQASKSMGSRFCDRMADWRVLLSGKEYDGEPIEARHCVRLRMLLAIVSNELYVEAILWTMPLCMMYAENSMMFVMDSLAALFITTLDDLPQTKVVKVLLQGAGKPYLDLGAEAGADSVTTAEYGKASP